MIDLVHHDISVYCFLLSFEAEIFYLQNEMKLVCTFDINTFKFQAMKIVNLMLETFITYTF